MAKFREKMETKRFLRSLIEAKLLYSGATPDTVHTIDRQPLPPRFRPRLRTRTDEAED